MKYITVLDFEVGRVFQYKIMDNGRLDTSALSADGDYYEDYLTVKGHNLSNCEWMIHEEPRVITTNHKAYQ